MDIKGQFDKLELNSDNLNSTLNQIEEALPFDISRKISEFSSSFTKKDKDKIFKSPEDRVEELFHRLELKFQLFQYPETFIEDMCKLIDEIVELTIPFDLKGARKIAELRLSWEASSPYPWYQLGIILFQLFVNRQIDDIDDVIKVFTHVIDLVEDQEENYDIGFWAYSYMANIYLYRILSGNEALEGAMKYSNQAYRFAQIHDIDVEDEFIFQNVEVLQKILMNQYPLLVIVYSHTGMKLYEYLFQLIEVINHDQRFIPNFTALLSVVDERINELFNSPISNAYIVIENKLMVLSTLYDEEKQNWVKIAFVFSYMYHSPSDMEIDDNILKKTKAFSDSLTSNHAIMDYFVNFDGRHDTKLYALIEEKIHEVFGK